MSSLKNVKIARISTVPYFVVTQLKHQLAHLVSMGAEVSVVTSDGKELAGLQWDDGLHLMIVDISRRLSPVKDIVTTVRLFYIFRKYRFDIVHSTTPKAGLLSAFAGFLAGVPIRLHTFTGQPWVNLSGPMAWLARKADGIIGRLTTHCYADSFSQREFLISKGVVNAPHISVIGAGSIAGVDLTRFDKTRFSHSECQELRAALGINDSSKVILFVGRITRDKGIFELLEAFRRTFDAGINVDLLLVGPLDQDCGGEETVSIDDVSGHSRIHHVGFTDCPERYMAIADLLCIPSYREGFGTVVIEAAAMGVPTLGTKIYGLKDSIEDGVTGVLVPTHDTNELSEAMMMLFDSPGRLQDMGVAAQARCQRNFDAKTINNQVVQEYVRLVSRL